MAYQLTISKVKEFCLFELTWGNAQRVKVTVDYPSELIRLYKNWSRAYMGYYSNNSRGKKVFSGQGEMPNIDWHGDLGAAEVAFLSEFHQWLRRESFRDIRSALILEQKNALSGVSQVEKKTELFVICDAIELARLPWETWEIMEGLGRQFLILRAPATVRKAAFLPSQNRIGKTRVLAILGRSEDLDLQGDRTVLDTQNRLLEVDYIEWAPGKNIKVHREEIFKALTDPKGWDILFFAGHSNERNTVSGQIFIAPNESISIVDILPALAQAREHGLQFALFNSCSGLDIAEALIDTGLSNVAISREPIQNELAQCFLAEFLHRLARFEDTQEALQGTCQFLKLEKKQTYPSAYLVPSLFRHPESVPFKVRPLGWRSRLQWLQFRKKEALFTLFLIAVSILQPSRDFLLDYRVWTQAIYRDFTGQTIKNNSSSKFSPPVVVVHIDQATITKRKLPQPLNYIDGQLLSDIINELSKFDARVVGIDYVLDEPEQIELGPLKSTFIQQVEQKGLWPVFAADQETTAPGSLKKWYSVYNHDTIASPTWSTEGNIDYVLWYVPVWQADQPSFPFSHQLALAYNVLNDNTNSSDIPRPNSHGAPTLQSALSTWTENQSVPPLSTRSQQHPITHFSNYLDQGWLQPILDFSLDPNDVYLDVSAIELLEDSESALASLSEPLPLINRIVIIAADGYNGAGLDKRNYSSVPGDITMREDLPPALRYWLQERWEDRGPWVSGGEFHAYMTHHLLTQWLVVPIPNLPMMMLAILLGKTLVIVGKRNAITKKQTQTLMHENGREHRTYGLKLSRSKLVNTAIIGYGLFSLQLYVSAAIMLPWLLPSILFYSCFSPYWDFHHGK